MSRAPADPELVAEALRRIDAGAHRNDVVRDLEAEGYRTHEGRPLSLATVRRAEAARKAAGEGGAPAAPPGPPPARPGGKRGAARGRPKAAPHRPARKVPPPKPIPLLPDALDEVTQALELTKGQLAALAGQHGYGAVGGLYDKLLKTKAAIERERKPQGSEAAGILARGAGALAKIRAGREVMLAREATTGCCARCKQKLPQETTPT